MALGCTATALRPNSLDICVAQCICVPRTDRGIPRRECPGERRVRASVAGALRGRMSRASRVRAAEPASGAVEREDRECNRILLTSNGGSATRAAKMNSRGQPLTSPPKMQLGI